MENGEHNTRIHISTASVVKVVLILILFVVAFLLRDLLLAVLAAVVVASAMEPMAEWLIERKVPRVPAVILLYLIIATLVASTFYFLVLPLLKESAIFLGSIPTYLDTTKQGVSVLTEGSVPQSIIENLPGKFTLREIVSELNLIINNVSAGFWSSVSLVFGGLMSFFLILVISFYLSVQEDGVGKFLKVISPLKHRKYVVHLWERSRKKIGLWMQGQLLLIVIVGVLVYLGLTLLGVKHALVLAALAGLFELIPLFGPILAAVPAVAIAFVGGGGVSQALLVAGLYLIIQQFENQLIYPLVVKKVVGVPPIISIIAIVAGAQLGGFMGLLLSVPVAAILMEFLGDLQRDHIEEEAKLPKA